MKLRISLNANVKLNLTPRPASSNRACREELIANVRRIAMGLSLQVDSTGDSRSGFSKEYLSILK